MDNKDLLNKQQPKNNNGNKPGKMFKFNLYWMYGLIFVMLIALYMSNGSTTTKELGWTEFQRLAKENVFEKMVVYNQKNVVEATVKASQATKVFKNRQELPSAGQAMTVVVKIPSADKFSDFYDKLVTDNQVDAQVSFEEGDSTFWNVVISLGPMILLILVWIYLMRRMSGGPGSGAGNVFSVGRSKAQLFDKDNDQKVTFKDVAGLAGAKQEVEEIVAFLKNPSKYTELGGKIPKGALLVGPPGTGKTLLAKAVAGEADVPFFSLSGSDFVEMFVGVGASRVRDLFRQAKEKAPCIVFIDEIDAVGRARGRNLNVNSNDERENTLNQLLTEMDGFGSNSGVIILAATNRADVLDKALLRAGRFDRQIHVDLPDLKERVEIFNVHLKNLKIEPGFDVEFLAKHTPGFSGADIANVCNEAALTAARRNKKIIDKQDFLDAVDRIVGGLERKTMIITPEEKRSIAHHEAGHATVSWFLKYANPLFKVTIVPRGQALGAAWYLPEERKLETREQMIDEMCALLGGRVAEEIVNGQPSTGALNDLERLTKTAYAMVTYYGMSEKVGTVSFYDSTGSRGYELSKPYSEKTAETIDREVKDLIQSIHDRTYKILMDHKEGFEQLAAQLLDKEVIFADDLEKIFGKRPWGTREDELETKNPDEGNDASAADAGEVEDVQGKEMADEK